MGMGMTGASLAGPPWGDFMMFANKDLPYKEFPMPEGKVHKATVCAETGEWPVEGCPTITLWFMDGTNPTEQCHIHSDSSANSIMMERMQTAEILSGQKLEIEDDGELELNLDFLDDSSSKKKNDKDDDSNFFMD